MANGRPRFRSAQTFAEHVETVNSFSPQSPEPSSFETSEGHTTPNDAKHLPFQPPDKNVKTKDQISGFFQTFVRSGSDISESRRLEQNGIILENEIAGMQESPAGSWNGSTTHDATPRIMPADEHRSLLPPITKIDDAPPFRQDSAYESVKGSDNVDFSMDVEAQVNNIRARERVQILRGRVSRTRRTINEKRPEVQILRERLRSETDKLMRVVNTAMALGHGQDLQSLRPQYDLLSQAQDELGPAEDAFDLLESRLIREEMELEEEEHHFYTHNNIALVPLPDSKLDEHISPLMKPYEPENPEFQNLDLDNDLVKQYLAKLSEAEQIKEQLDDLENEQYRLSEELSFRARFNLTLAAEKSEFLFDFPKRHKKMLETLETVEDDLYDLRNQCVEAHLFSDSQYVYEPHDALVEEIQDCENDAKDRSPWRVFQPSTKHHAGDVNFENKWEYVNTWLLKWVQDSTVETMQLKAFIYFQYPKEAKPLEGEEWSELALQYWDCDKAGIFKNAKQVPSTMDALLGGTGTSLEREGSLDVDPGDGGHPEVIIMGSEAGSYATQKNEPDGDRGSASGNIPTD
ncbi:hypothetical protein D0Z07_6573 [Hyphodiscus hymeniophilus]|uniref:Uncharacterized protein n=1 Tax=Hyphodiscus hymeniophilus TaxID=353542 RepID=A0A9P6VHA2_9HELO|nr:hypothetical protein D0Z07_6573 [Hyphodiscus hymeniophilus]